MLPTKLPDLYLRLQAADVLPRDAATADRRLGCPLQTLIPVSQIFPEERAISFYAPPLHSIADELPGSHIWSRNPAAVDQIDPRRVFPFADFGAGSDTCIAFRYHDLGVEPDIIRLVWDGGVNTAYWVHVASSFDLLWDMLTTDRTST